MFSARATADSDAADAPRHAKAGRVAVYGLDAATTGSGPQAAQEPDAAGFVQLAAYVDAHATLPDDLKQHLHALCAKGIVRDRETAGDVAALLDDGHVASALSFVVATLLRLKHEFGKKEHDAGLFESTVALQGNKQGLMKEIKAAATHLLAPREPSGIFKAPTRANKADVEAVRGLPELLELVWTLRMPKGAGRLRGAPWNAAGSVAHLLDCHERNVVVANHEVLSDVRRAAMSGKPMPDRAWNLVHLAETALRLRCRAHALFWDQAEGMLATGPVTPDKRTRRPAPWAPARPKAVYSRLHYHADQPEDRSPFFQNAQRRLVMDEETDDQEDLSDTDTEGLVAVDTFDERRGWQTPPRQKLDASHYNGQHSEEDALEAALRESQAISQQQQQLQARLDRIAASRSQAKSASATAGAEDVVDMTDDLWDVDVDHGAAAPPAPAFAFGARSGLDPVQRRHGPVADDGATAQHRSGEVRVHPPSTGLPNATPDDEVVWYTAGGRKGDRKARRHKDRNCFYLRAQSHLDDIRASEKTTLAKHKPCKRCAK